MTLRLRTALATLALAGIAFFAGRPASASTISYSGFTEPYSVIDTLTDGSYSVTADAGQINLHLNNGTTLAAFCDDIFDELQSSGTYSVSALTAGSSPGHVSLSATQISEMNALLSNGLATANNSEASAALQAAIWQVEYNNSLSPYTQSPLSQYGTDSSAVSDFVNDLCNVASGTWVASASQIIMQLTSTSGANQSLIYLAPAPTTAVPEPASIALLGIGLAGLTVAARRRHVARSSAA